MPFNGSGTFTRLMNWSNDALAGIKIKSDRHDQEDDNFASGLSNTITKDGQTQPTADIPMNGKKITNLGAPINDTDASTKAYADLPKPSTTGLTISGADANGRLTFSSPTGVNGLSFTGADLSWLARLATLAGPGTPPVPPATPNRMVLNDKPDGSGTDVATINDTGGMTIAGSFVATGNVTGSAIYSKGSLTTQVIGFQGPAGEDRGLLYTNGAAAGPLYLRNSTQHVFEFNNAGQIKAPGGVFAGSAYLNTNGNIESGSLWTVWGAGDAFNAIDARIEARAQYYSGQAVQSMAYRRVSAGTIGGITGNANIFVPAGTVMCGFTNAGGVTTQCHYIYLQIYDPWRGWVGFTG